MSNLEIWKVGTDVKIRDTDGEVSIATNDLVTQDELTAGLADKLGQSFQRIVGNLDSYDFVPTLNGDGDLATQVFTLPDASTITITYGYTGGNLTSITLSGAIPAGIDTTKLITYDGNGDITGVSYS